MEATGFRAADRITTLAKRGEIASISAEAVSRPV